MRTAIITANFGCFDTVKALIKQNGEYDFYSFNEGNCPFPMTVFDDRMKAKYFKMQAHKILPGYDNYIWIDGSFWIKSNDFLSFMLDSLAGYDIAVTKHPDRNSITQEADFVLKLLVEGNQYISSRYQHSKIGDELEYITKDLGYLDNNGLYACGFFIRRNDPKTNAMFNHWWDHTLRFSAFDQLSFPFLAQHHGIRINPLVFDNYYDNHIYTLTKHAKVK